MRNTELTKMERKFLIKCIIAATYEGYLKDFYLEKYFTNEEIIDLMIFLGATDKDIDLFENIL